MDLSTRVNIDNGIKFILSVKIHIPPERVDEFFALFKPVYEVVVAEPECRYFVVGQDLQTPGAIWWCEGWSESVDWFSNVQMKKDYYAPYLAATEPMFTQPRQVEMYAPANGLTMFKTASVSAGENL